VCHRFSDKCHQDVYENPGSVREGCHGQAEADAAMHPMARALSRTAETKARGWWTDHRYRTLRLSVILMAVLALLKLGSESRRLVWDSGANGAIDLRILHGLVHQWFAGEPIYEELSTAVHPPGTYVILWPSLGWLTLPQARWIWAATSGLALASLAWLVVQESGATSPVERCFVALMPLSLNATGVTIGNGQLTIHLVTLLLVGVLLQKRRRDGVGWRLLASGIVTFTLVKPTVSLPFIWLILFGAGGLGTTLLAGVGYIGLTALSASFQDEALHSLLAAWVVRGSHLALRGGYANMHIWAGALGLDEWLLPISLATLLGLGAWVYAHRHQDVWLLLGITALVARFWTYHRLYDDMLVLLPMVSLFRIAKQGARDEWQDIAASALLGALLLAMLLPARLRYTPWPWQLVFTGGHTLMWAAVLLFLLLVAERSGTQA
jgi:hypothetical protein